MFKKYSNSRDCLYSIIILSILFLFSLFVKNLSIFSFNTQNVANMLANIFAGLFVFMLTIITIMFMFDYKQSPIFRKLENDNLYKQIFKRFFDSLIVIVIALVYFLLLSIYFSNDVSFGLTSISGLSISLSIFLNFVISVFLILSSLRIYRCLNLLKLIYQSVTYHD